MATSDLPSASVTATIIQVADPLGSVIAYAGSTDPPTANLDGAVTWLLCDGRPLKQADYPELFKVIGTAFGGDSITFNIPDLRGRFIRGTDTMNGPAAGRDPDIATREAMNPGGNTGTSANKIGSVQWDAFKSHSHDTIRPPWTWKEQDAHEGGDQIYTGKVIFDQIFPLSTYNTGGNETRPANAYLNYIIRVK